MSPCIVGLVKGNLLEQDYSKRQNQLYTDIALLGWLQVKIFTNYCTSAESGEIIVTA